MKMVWILRYIFGVKLRLKYHDITTNTNVARHHILCYHQVMITMVKKREISSLPVSNKVNLIIAWHAFKWKISNIRNGSVNMSNRRWRQNCHASRTEIICYYTSNDVYSSLVIHSIKLGQKQNVCTIIIIVMT